MNNTTRLILVALSGLFVVGCSSDPDAGPTSPLATPTAASPSQYVLPSEVGTYTNVWGTDSPVDLQSEAISVIRAAVEGYAVAFMVGPENSYPGYQRFIDEGIEAYGGSHNKYINVRLPLQLPPPIAVTGTMHHLLYDVIETETTVDARICEVDFGIYQPHPTHPRRPYEPADLRPVTDPDLLSPENNITVAMEMWRIRIERDPQGPPTESSSTTPSPAKPDEPTDPERYPNKDVFKGWSLKQYTYESGRQRPCTDWGVKQYPMALVDSFGLAYPTNPIEASYLPTLPPSPGWTHVPAV